MSSSTTGILTTYARDYDDSENTSAVGDYSTAEAYFDVKPPADETWDITRLITYIEDSGAFDSGGYGNGSVLANGIKIELMQGDTVITDLIDAHPIKQNTHWKRLCYDIALSTFGTGNESLSARWTFTKAGAAIRLRGENSEKIRITVRDNHTNLVEQSFMFQGMVV